MSLSKLSNNLEVILKNASSCVNKNNVELSGRAQARCDILESIAELSGMTLDDRLNLINKEYQGVELESILNISPNYYRERYFALLELVARSIKTDK